VVRITDRAAEPDPAWAPGRTGRPPAPRNYRYLQHPENHSELLSR
jgi:hypothetical protein